MAGYLTFFSFELSFFSYVRSLLTCVSTHSDLRSCHLVGIRHVLKPRHSSRQRRQLNKKFSVSPLLLPVYLPLRLCASFVSLINCVCRTAVRNVFVNAAHPSSSPFCVPPFYLGRLSPLVAASLATRPTLLCFEWLGNALAGPLLL
jgi:hypothetical protein